MKSLKSSIESNTNLFTNTKDLYALKYAEYELKKQELNQTYLDATEQYNASDKLFESGAVSKSDYQKAYATYLQSKLTYEQYETSFMATLGNDIDETQLQIQKLNSELKKLSPDLHTNKNYLPVETKTIIDIDNQIATVNQDLRSLRESLIKKKLEVEKSIIIAEPMVL